MSVGDRREDHQDWFARDAKDSCEGEAEDRRPGGEQGQLGGRVQSYADPDRPATAPCNRRPVG
eukprot:4242686-Heterocapsa_arctica.AAC.1